MCAHVYIRFLKDNELVCASIKIKRMLLKTPLNASHTHAHTHKARTTVRQHDRWQRYWKMFQKIQKKKKKKLISPPQINTAQSRLPFGASEHVASSRGCFGR